jgi:hypothetical protein
VAKKKTSGAGIILLLLLGAILSIPKEAWEVIGTVAGLCLLVYLIRKSTSAREGAPDRTPDSRHALVARRIRPELSFSVRSGRDDVAPDPLMTSALCWVPPGRSAAVANVTLASGMLYVGSGMPSVSGGEIEPALIDPALPVRRTDSAQRMPYWPSYSQISPEARAEYLNWLSTGRRDPSVQLGYVFLFFYGLERRLLHDAKSAGEEVAAERPALVAELQSLLHVYGDSGSFHGYASSLLDALAVSEPLPDRPYASAAPEPSGGRGMRLIHKIALGKAALDAAPVPASWAYSWLMSDEMSPRRRAALRCPEEFKRIFLAMYTLRYGQGMVLPVSKTRLKVSYRPASASFSTPLTFGTAGLPDITVLKRPIDELRALAMEASETLSPYSRFIGRNPEKRATMDATALLPPLLWPRESLAGLANWLRRLGVGREPQIATLRDLLRHFPEWTTMNRDRAVGLAVALEYLGVGIDPDVRWGAAVPGEAISVALFKITREDRGKVGSAAYAVAALTVQLAVAVAVADGVTAEERKYIEDSIDRMEHLEAYERYRLHAHLKWLIQVQPSLTPLKVQNFL